MNKHIKRHENEYFKNWLPVERRVYKKEIYWLLLETFHNLPNVTRGLVTGNLHSVWNGFGVKKTSISSITHTVITVQGVFIVDWQSENLFLKVGLAVPSEPGKWINRWTEK